MRWAGQDMGFVHDDQTVCVGAFPNPGHKRIAGKKMTRRNRLSEALKSSILD